MQTLGWSKTVSFPVSLVVVYNESRKRDLKTRPIYECRCDERLKTKTEKSTRLVYTGFLHFFVYYESRKTEVKTRPIYECRCDERLKTKTEKSTPPSHIHWVGRGTGTPKDKDEVIHVSQSKGPCLL